MKGLTDEQIASLLKPKPTVDRRPKWQKRAAGDRTLTEEEKWKKIREKYPLTQQVGPLRRFDTDMRCASRRCGCPTVYKVQGIPYCSIHALRLMNEMLVAKGVLS